MGTQLLWEEGTKVFDYPERSSCITWGGEEHTDLCSMVTRVFISKALCKGQRFIFLQTHFVDASFQEKTEAEAIRRTVISVAFLKADRKEQVLQLSEMVFQPQFPLPLRNGDVTVAR